MPGLSRRSVAPRDLAVALAIVGAAVLLVAARPLLRRLSPAPSREECAGCSSIFISEDVILKVAGSAEPLGGQGANGAKAPGVLGVVTGAGKSLDLIGLIGKIFGGLG